MNCKPDCIAVILGGNGAYTDRLVDVVRLHGISLLYPEMGPLWFVKPIGFKPHDCATTEHGEFLFPDARLRPINNPGDDEVDEISLRRDVPEGVPA